MTRRSISLEDFPAILEQLPSKFQDAAVRGLRSAAHRLKGYTVMEIIQRAKASGELARSVTVTNLHDGAAVTVEAPHANFVEKGTRPHMPPLQPLIDWVEIKGFARGEQAVQIARRVQHAIARRGTRPVHYFRKAVDRVEPEIIGEIIREWNKI